jgi:hypothetical protein
MSLPIVFSRALTAAVTTSIASDAATVAGGGLFTLVSTTVALDAQRRVLFTPLGDESGNVFTIVGLNDFGNKITENLAGANATSFYSNLDFKTIISVSPQTATESTVTIGTNAIGSSPWQIVNWNVQPFNLGFVAELRGGAVNFTVEHTYDDPNNLLAGAEYPLPLPNAVVSGASATAEGSYVVPVTALRLTTNSGTGTLWFRMIQEGLASP